MLTTRRPRFGAEVHRARSHREQGVILADADIRTGVEVGTPLAHDDLAGVDLLTAETLHAEALGVRVATVPGARSTFLCAMVQAPNSIPVTLTMVCS